MEMSNTKSVLIMVAWRVPLFEEKPASSPYWRVILPWLVYIGQQPLFLDVMLNMTEFTLLLDFWTKCLKRLFFFPLWTESHDVSGLHWSWQSFLDTACRSTGLHPAALQPRSTLSVLILHCRDECSISWLPVSIFYCRQSCFLLRLAWILAL